MITQVSCPACQFKLSIPEGDMGKRQVCSNCHSPFFAGASITEPRIAGKPLLGPAPAYQQTMLANTAPAIKFNCPRCQAPLEALSIEAGTKKPCSACGQRLQVPTAPPPPTAAPQPSLNKTMLAGDERSPAAPPIKYNCPSCKKPLESPASEAGIKKPCPACGQRLQIPAASSAPQQPNRNKTMLAGDASSPQPYGGQPGYAPPTAPGAAPGAPATAAPGGITIGSYTVSKRNFAIAAAVVVFLLLVVPAVIRGGKTEDAEKAAAQKIELEKATAEIERKKAEVEKINQLVTETSTRLARLEDKMRDDHREAISRITDQRLRAETQDKQDRETANAAKEKREMEDKLQKLAAETKAALDKAESARTTIINQPPPVYYRPFYHPRYYWDW